jgi:uncharacterized protein (TIGR02246 family)
MGGTLPARDGAADEAAIRVLERAYDEAWDAADLPAVMRVFTEDVVVLDPLGGVSVGREGFERRLAAVFDGLGKGSRHVSCVERVSFVTDAVALVDGEAVITGFRDAAGELHTPIRHRFTDVVVKAEGGWRIAHIRACALSACSPELERRRPA